METTDRGTLRRTIHRGLVPVAVLVVLVLGFGLVDLAAGLVPGDSPWHVMNVGYGLLAGVLFPVAFIAQLWDRWTLAGIRLSLLLGLAVVVSYAIGTRWDTPGWGEGGPAGGLNVGLLVVPSMMLLAAFPGNPYVAPRRAVDQRRMLGFSLVAGVLWASLAVYYAIGQWEETRPYEAARNGYGGWTGLCAFALALGLLSVWTGLVPEDRPLFLPLLLLGAASFSAICLAYPDEPGTMGPRLTFPVLLVTALHALAVHRDTKRHTTEGTS